jgi:hypothetical protein
MISCWIFLIMRNVSVKSCRKCQNTHFVFNNLPPPRKSCRFWGNVEKYGRTRQAADDDITRRMRFAFWITTAMLLLGKENGSSNAPQSIIYIYITSFVSKWYLRLKFADSLLAFVITAKRVTFLAISFYLIYLSWCYVLPTAVTVKFS